MKRLFGGLSDLFATWASAGQYGSIHELEAPEENSPAPASKVSTLRKATAHKRPHRASVTPNFGGSSGPDYFTGSMLVKKKLG
jgi:hypothetical protein